MTPRRLLMPGLLCLLPATLPAQRWAQQVQGRLDQAIAAVRPIPQLPVVQRSGILNLDEAASFQAPLVQGTTYSIVAVCDDDCTVLELTLLTSRGSELAKQRNSESLPTILFTVDRTDLYGIRVRMEGCRWNPCWYGVAIVPQRKRAASR